MSAPARTVDEQVTDAICGRTCPHWNVREGGCQRIMTFRNLHTDREAKKVGHWLKPGARIECIECGKRWYSYTGDDWIPEVQQ